MPGPPIEAAEFGSACSCSCSCPSSCASACSGACPDSSSCAWWSCTNARPSPRIPFARTWHAHSGRVGQGYRRAGPRIERRS